MGKDVSVTERKKKWYIENADRLKEYRKEYYSRPEVKDRVKKWRKDNKDRINSSKRRYHENNKEVDNLRMKEYRKNNPEKVCEMQKKWRKNNPELWKYHHDKSQKKYADNNGIVIDAHRAVSRAIKSGKLKILRCEICGYEESEAHHDDYNKPLEVRWLCKKCHVNWHKHNKPIKERME